MTNLTAAIAQDGWREAAAPEAPAKELQLLLVGASPESVAAIERALSAAGLAPATTLIGSTTELAAALRRTAHDIVLCEARPSVVDVAAVLKLAHELDALLPIIIIAPDISDERAAELMGAGAADVLLAAKIGARLAPAVQREIVAAKARRDAIGNEQRFRDFTRVAADWLFEMGPDHRYTFSAGNSDHARELPARNVLGRTRWELAGIDPETDEKWARHKADLDAHRPFRGFRYELHTEGGAIFHVSVSGNPIFDERGRFAGYRGTVTDETAMREATRRAETAEALLRDAVDSISEGFVIYDDRDCFVMCNDAYRRMYPESADEMRSGVPFEAILRAGLAKDQYPDARGRKEEWLAERLRRHGQAAGTVEQRQSDGKWALITDRRMPNGWTAGLRIDITKLKNAQEALLESERMARGIVETAHDAFIQTDERGVIVEWNRQAETTFGWTREEAIGKEIGTLIQPPPDRASPGDSLARLMQGVPGKELEQRIELELLRHGGKEITVEVSVAALPRRSGTLFNAFIRDITGRLATEAQLRQAQKMEAIGNLTGGMAHDFNNLLGIIIGNLDLVENLAVADGESAELLKDALDAALRGADLTRRLLAFARRQPLRPQHADVNSLITGITALLRRTLGENIAIEVELGPDAWPVRIDPAQLESAITNLATNARDAMPKGGILYVRTANRHLDEAYAAENSDVQPGDYVLIEVCDTGVGIPATMQAHIFEPFFTTKPVGAGTGLGLSMVFGFVKQSGGHISVYSEEGKGTCFRLYLPRACSSEEAAIGRRATTRQIPGGSETVLVVEDNEKLRRIVVRQLTDLGYRVLEVENATQALESLDANAVDLLFTDIVMPGEMSGAELAHAARRRRPALKVLYTSGFPEAHLGGEGMPCDDVELLSKPYRKEELAHMLRQVLDRREG